MQITDGEKLYIYRKRRALTQGEFATSGVAKNQFHVSMMERDLRDAPHKLEQVELVLTQGEKAKILRRRSGDTVMDTAKKLKKSHVYVLGMENGVYDPAPLLSLYKQYENIS